MREVGRERGEGGGREGGPAALAEDQGGKEKEKEREIKIDR